MWGALQFWAHLAMKARLLLNLALQLLRHRQCVLQVVAHASRLRLVYMQRVHWQDDAHLFCSAAVRGRQRLLGRGAEQKEHTLRKRGWLLRASAHRSRVFGRASAASAHRIVRGRMHRRRRLLGAQRRNAVPLRSASQ